MDGQQMKALRKRHGMTQKQLAQILGVTPDYIGKMENAKYPVSEQIDAKLSEWDGGTPPLDELPEPPYTPGVDTPEDEEPPDEPSPARPRSSSRRKKGLTVWQEETAAALTSLVVGTEETIEVNGQSFPVVIPGLCHLIAQVDQFDAVVVGNGTPALSVALVKIAPRHPWLKAILETMTMGGEYGELARAALAIAVPILIHHNMLTMGGGRPMPSASENGSGGDEG